MSTKDTTDLISWLRDFIGPCSAGTNEAADAIESLDHTNFAQRKRIQELVAENEKLRREVEFKKARVRGAESDYEAECTRADRAEDERDALRAQLDSMTKTRTIEQFHATREGGSGCPEVDGGPHYFAFLDSTVDYRVCIDCGAPEGVQS